MNRDDFDFCLYYAINQTNLRTVENLLEMNKGLRPYSTALNDVWRNNKPDTKSRVEMASLLILYGAEVNEIDSYGETPLIMACQGSVECMQLLLGAGADPNKSGKSGLTPLMAVNMSRSSSCDMMVNALKNAGAKA